MDMGVFEVYYEIGSETTVKERSGKEERGVRSINDFPRVPSHITLLVSDTAGSRSQNYNLLWKRNLDRASSSNGEEIKSTPSPLSKRL